MNGQTLALSLFVALFLLACEGTSDSSTAPDLTVQYARGAAAESVTGSGHFHTDPGQWRTFSFAATKAGDGSVQGTYHFRIHDEQGTGSRIWGRVTCFVIEGNEAWVAGIVRKAGNPNNEGTPQGFHVVDNGQGGDALPDQVTVPWSGQMPTEEYCGTRPDFQILRDVEAGNVQIHQ